MKKRFVFIVLIALFLSVFTFEVLASESTSYTENDCTYTYSINNNEATITGFSGSGDVVIPSKIGEYSVTAIAKYAFSWKSGLTSVVIPDGIVCIEKYAFNDCRNLTKIVIPSSLNSIEENAFSSIGNIKTAGPIGGGYDLEFGWKTSIPDNAFMYMGSLTSVSIPNSVESIGKNAFYCCNNITTIDLPESLISIGNYAFGYCGLNSIYIPENVSSIGYDVFSGLDFATAGPHGGRYDYEFGWKTSIPANAFNGCHHLSWINLPDSITSIGDQAFFNCEKLDNIELPVRLNDIGVCCFAGCSSLSSIQIPETVIYIGNGAFSGCSAIETINIPKGVSSIGGVTFAGCSKLHTVNISNGVTSIYEAAFMGCTNLTSISIPASVTTITESAFDDCGVSGDNGKSELCVYFKGDAPSVFHYSEFSNNLMNSFPPTATLYYIEGTEGWSSPKWHGYTAYPITSSGEVIYEKFAINSITVRDSDGSTLAYIPYKDFLASVSITNLASEGNTLVMLAAYTAKGQYKGLMWVTVEDLPIGATISVTLPVDNDDGTIAQLKAFTIASFSNLVPLGTTASYPAL